VRACVRVYVRVRGCMRICARVSYITIYHNKRLVQYIKWAQKIELKKNIKNELSK